MRTQIHVYRMHALGGGTEGCHTHLSRVSIQEEDVSAESRLHLGQEVICFSEYLSQGSRGVTETKQSKH